MKVKLLATILLAFSLQSQTSVQVSVGSGYQNQTWYSLQNDVQGTSQSKDNWDLGFEITGYSASIIANTQKPNFVLYKAPFTTLQWNSLDTVGIVTWPKLYNSDSSWALGAFNSTVDPNNAFDLGWGVYDINTHYVIGDSSYVIKLANNVYKKLIIDNLSNGSYNFTYADIDGNNEKQVSIAKSAYTGKNFAYFNLTEGKALDREPVSANWDLTFTRYTALLSSGASVTPYPVVGILQNKGVTVAQVNNIPDVQNYNNYAAHTFVTAINEIGYDWKSVDINTGVWSIVQESAYFVKDKSNKIWKLIFTDFGGSANGEFSFTKEELLTTDITDVQGMALASFSIYPNPTVGDQLQVLFGTEMSNVSLQATITDLHGSVQASQDLSLQSGISKGTMEVTHLKSGVYYLTLVSNSKTFVQKFVKL